MPRPKKLRWGKSPFDDMPHDELLFWARRMYAACLDARGALGVLQSANPTNLYWSLPHGTGGRAMAMLDIVVEEIQKKFDRESIYRSFYRYTVDLLFRPTLGFGWHLCLVPKCGTMIGHDADSVSPATCPAHRDEKMMRPITWEDIKPNV